MKRLWGASLDSTTSWFVEHRCRLSPCLMAILVGACSVDIGNLRGSVSSAYDGASDLSVVPDVDKAGIGDATGGAVSIDVEDIPVSRDLPDVDDVEGPDDVRAIPEPDTAGDANISVDVVDVPELPAAVKDTRGDLPDIGGRGGSGGSGGSDDAGGVDADGGGGSGGTDGGRDGTGGVGGFGGVDPDLILWYRFDESNGTIASDASSSGGGGRDGTLGTTGTGGSATFTTDCQVGTHALSLVTPSYGRTPAGGYVTIPAPEDLAPGAITIAVWVKLAAATSAQNWERIFDFGNGTSGNGFFYLTARASDAPNTPLRFGISKSGHTASAEQRIESPSTFTANVWHHIAIVLPAGATFTGAMYIDGVVVATNNAITLHLSDVGNTTQNWLGRSPYSDDPFFYGSLDDFRIYKRALSASEVSALVTFR